MEFRHDDIITLIFDGGKDKHKQTVQVIPFTVQKRNRNSSQSTLDTQT